MSADPRGERLQIMLTSEELAALDQWRFSRHMPSRGGRSRAVAPGIGSGRLRHYGRKDKIRRFLRDCRDQASKLTQAYAEAAVRRYLRSAVGPFLRSKFLR